MLTTIIPFFLYQFVPCQVKFSRKFAVETEIVLSHKIYKFSHLIFSISRSIYQFKSNYLMSEGCRGIFIFLSWSITFPTSPLLDPARWVMARDYFSWQTTFWLRCCIGHVIIHKVWAVSTVLPYVIWKKGWIFLCNSDDIIQLTKAHFY